MGRDGITGAETSSPQAQLRGDRAFRYAAIVFAAGLALHTPITCVAEPAFLRRKYSRRNGVHDRWQLRPGYSVVRQAVSDLGLGPNAWLQTTNFLVFGLLIIVFAIGLPAACDQSCNADGCGPPSSCSRCAASG